MKVASRSVPLAASVSALTEVTQLITNSELPMMKASSSVRSWSVCRPSDGQTATAINAVNARKKKSAAETSGTSTACTSST